MNTKKQNFISKFLRSDKDYPIVAGVAAGLYPVLFYYSKNFSMLDTWAHVGYFLGLFVLVPAIGFFLIHQLSKLPIFNKYKKYVLPFLTLFTFLFILKTLLYIPIERKLIVYSIIASAVFAYYLHQHYKKLILIQFLMALFAAFTLSQVLYNRVTYSDAWKEQPDDIASVVFEKKPNVYFFEPDGYVGFKQLKEPPYSFDNSTFESFLKKNDFKTYPDFRTNYVTTLASNGATFTMKHHYYDFNLELEEVENATSIIISENPVLDAFKNNGYETYFLSSSHYFLLNRPKMGYHHSNIDYSKIAYLHNGMGEREPIVKPFLRYLEDDIEKPKFFFVQFLLPWHVSSHENSAAGVEGEREAYLDRLEEANTMLTEMISKILEKDPNALILMMSDHGGYVGLTFTRESYAPVTDPVLVKSIFKSNLTIHWPENDIPAYDEELDSPVNVFRVLFSYLSGNKNFIKHLEPDESFIIHKEGIENGVYKYFNDKGDIIFEKMEPPQ
jgi:Sulfatase